MAKVIKNTRIDYKRTLLSITAGEEFKVKVIALDDTGFRRTASRLKQRGAGLWVCTTSSDNTMTIKRIS